MVWRGKAQGAAARSGHRSKGVGFSRRAPLLAVLATLAAYYLLSYAQSPQRPHLGQMPPAAWWGWADQSEYFRSAWAFSAGAFNWENFHYPPLYALTAVPFFRLMPLHPYLVPDLLLFVGFFGVLASVARRFYGLALPVIVCAALFTLLPAITIQQWVIPWTSTLAAGLGASLILFYAIAERRQAPFALISGGDWLRFAGFFVLYGAFAPTRPLEIVVWFPLALAFFVRTTFATVRRAGGTGRGWAVFLGCGAVAGVCGLVFVAFFLIFNLKILGGVFGGPYAQVSAAEGYRPAEIGEKALSIFRNSQALFAEGSEALFVKVPVLAPIFAIDLVVLFTVRDIRFWIILTAFFHFLVYLPYGDLIPSGFFRYHNNHYFKWAWPWLAVVAVGEAWGWTRATLRGSTAGAGPLAAALAVWVVGLSFDLSPTNLALVEDDRDAAHHVIAVTLPQRRSVQFVEIQGLRGARDQFDSPRRQLLVDGRPYPNASHRFYPSPDGGRVIFLEPVTMSRMTLATDPKLAFAPGRGRSLVGSVAVRADCLIRTCTSGPQVPWGRGQIAFGLGVDGDLQGATLTGWSIAEPWGRWTEAGRASIAFKVRPPSGGMSVSSRFTGMPGRFLHRRPHISLWVNGCRIGEQRPKLGEKSTIEGPVPRRCWDGGALVVEWRTDSMRRPVEAFHVPDTRKLGVAVETLVLRQTP